MQLFRSSIPTKFNHDNAQFTGQDQFWLLVNQNDYLYDSTDNDRIEAGGGDDVINAMRGGSDILIGGAGIYSQWQSDNALTAEQRAGGKAYFSDKYLHDRAAMLSWQIQANQADSSTVGTDDWVFIDAATNGRVTNRNLNSTAVAHQVYFGDSSANSFTGGAIFADQYIGALKRRGTV